MCSKCWCFFCCCCKDADVNVVGTAAPLKVYFPYPEENPKEDFSMPLGAANKLDNGLFLLGSGGFVYIHNENSPDFINNRFTAAQKPITDLNRGECVETKRGSYRKTKEMNNNSALESKRMEDEGWKLHISIKRTQNNLDTAWKILQDVCEEYGLHYLKTPLSTANLDKTPAGKEFTLYLFKNPTIDDWSPILKRIENKLRENNVKKGLNPGDYDKQVENSNYLYYRNDKSASGKGGSVRPEDIDDMAKENNTISKYNPHNYPLPKGLESLNPDLGEESSSSLTSIPTNSYF